MPFKHSAQRSATHFVQAIEAQPNTFSGDVTYADVNVIIKNIQNSGYFDKASQPPAPPTPVPAVANETTVEIEELPPNMNNNNEEQNLDIVAPNEIDGGNDANGLAETDFHKASAAAAAQTPILTPPQQMVQQMPVGIVTTPPIIPVVGLSTGGVITTPIVPLPQPNQMHPSHLTPTTVRAVEQAYFKQHQYMQQPQMRPLAEVIGARNFFFLQDSELDSPSDLMQQLQPHFPPQVSPTPLQPTANQPQQHPTQIIQQPQMSSVSQQQQLSTQTFTNISFPNMVSAATPMFAATMKTVDDVAQQQAHISSASSTTIQMSQQVLPSQPLQQQLNSHPTAIAQHSAFPNKFAASNQQNMIPVVAVSKEVCGIQLKEQSIEQRVPDITEWKPEDVSKSAEEMTEWREAYHVSNSNPIQEVTDWNEDIVSGSVVSASGDDSNTWSNNQRFPYRNQQSGNGGGGSYNGRQRGSSGRTSAGGGGESRNGSTNGYRNNRPNSSYQPNGRQSGGGGNGAAAANNVSGGPNANPNTFYRNNDNFYQNGGCYRGDNKDNGNNYRGGAGGGEKGQDFRTGGNFRSRDMRSGNGVGVGVGSSSRNNRYNSDSTERGSNSATINGAGRAITTAPASNTNSTNRNGVRSTAAGSTNKTAAGGSGSRSIPLY